LISGEDIKIGEKILYKIDGRIEHPEEILAEKKCKKYLQTPSNKVFEQG